MLSVERNKRVIESAQNLISKDNVTFELLLRCPKRECVPTLIDMCKTIVCVRLHELGVESELHSDIPITHKNKKFLHSMYHKGIWRLNGLTTYLPLKFINYHLKPWYIMLDKQTDLMNDLRHHRQSVVSVDFHETVAYYLTDEEE